MRHGIQIWSWDDAAKRLEEARQYRKVEAGSDSVSVRLSSTELVAECATLRRLLEAKNVECARLQKRVEELEESK